MNGQDFTTSWRVICFEHLMFHMCNSCDIWIISEFRYLVGYVFYSWVDVRHVHGWCFEQSKCSPTFSPNVYKRVARFYTGCKVLLRHPWKSLIPSIRKSFFNLFLLCLPSSRNVLFAFVELFAEIIFFKVLFHEVLVDKVIYILQMSKKS